MPIEGISFKYVQCCTVLEEKKQMSRDTIKYAPKDALFSVARIAAACHEFLIVCDGIELTCGQIVSL